METDTSSARIWWPMARRSQQRELLDVGRVSGAELRTNLSDLARLNRLPGGVRASVSGVGRLVAGCARPTIVDVGTGSADMPVAFASRGWRVLAVEPDPDVAAVARARIGAERSVEVVVADGRALPVGDASVDVAHASLLLHHLDPADAVAVLREMARVARRGVVINDLRRGVATLVATGVAVSALGRCRTTRHDGLLSVRRAYTLDELDHLLNDAGLRAVQRSWAWMPRVVSVAVHEGA